MNYSQFHQFSSSLNPIYKFTTSVTELGVQADWARRGGWVQSNDPNSQRVTRPRLTTHGRARQRTVPFLSYLTQHHDLSNSTTQILEESNVHDRERRCVDGRKDGRILFSFTLHTFSIFSIQRPKFPKTLTCMTKIFSCAPFAKRKSSAAYWQPTRVINNKNL